MGMELRGLYQACFRLLLFYLLLDGLDLVGGEPWGIPLYDGDGWGTETDHRSAGHLGVGMG